MLDQMLFKLACGHELVLGRLGNLESWVCEACGKPTDLKEEPFKSALERDLDTAMQIDAQERGQCNDAADVNGAASIMELDSGSHRMSKIAGAAAAIGSPFGRGRPSTIHPLHQSRQSGNCRSDPAPPGPGNVGGARQAAAGTEPTCPCTAELYGN
jgi:hypothetical protein